MTPEEWDAKRDELRWPIGWRRREPLSVGVLLDGLPIYVHARGGFQRVDTVTAREMAAALMECADWVERQEGGK